MVSSDAPQRAKIIVGLDYGTTYTGISWAESTAVGSDAIRVLKVWPGPGKGTDETWKTPSRIAYADENDSISQDHWGYMVTPKMISYSWTKLLLDEKTDPTEFDDPELSNMYHNDSAGLFRLPAGKSATEVAADFLYEIHEYFMAELEKRLTKEVVSITPIETWLTVPATWSDKAKDATKKAAITAGFASRNIDSLFLIPEPEAAAITALTSMQTTGLDATALKVNDNVLVCDMGGGTVDITTYNIQKLAPDFEFTEILVGIGGKAESTYVDREFYRWMSEKFGDNFDYLLSFEKKGPGSRFMKEFEAVKRDFGNSDEPHQTFEIPLNMHGVKDSDIYDTDESVVILTKENMKSFFRPVLTKVMKLLTSQVELMEIEHPERKVDVIVLCGGFGDSSYVLDKIRDWGKVHGGIRVVCPPNPQAAIVKGAVLRGLAGIHPTSRRCRRHYGIRFSRPFRKGIDAPEDAYTDPWHGIKYCRGNMHWQLKKGDEITEETFVTYEYRRTRHEDDDQIFEVDLFCCDQSEPPMKVKNPSVKYLGAIRANYTQFDIEDFEQKIIDDQLYYRVAFNVEIVPADKLGVLTFRLRCDDHIIGTYELNYDKV